MNKLFLFISVFFIPTQVIAQSSDELMDYLSQKQKRQEQGENAPGKLRLDLNDQAVGLGSSKSDALNTKSIERFKTMKQCYDDLMKYRHPKGNNLYVATKYPAKGGYREGIIVLGDNGKPTIHFVPQRITKRQLVEKRFFMTPCTDASGNKISLNDPEDEKGVFAYYSNSESYGPKPYVRIQRFKKGSDDDVEDLKMLTKTNHVINECAPIDPSETNPDAEKEISENLATYLVGKLHYVQANAEAARENRLSSEEKEQFNKSVEALEKCSQNKDLSKLSKDEKHESLKVSLESAEHLVASLKTTSEPSSKSAIKPKQESQSVH